MVVQRKLNKREIIIITVVLAIILIIFAWANYAGQSDTPDTIVSFNFPEGNVSFNCEVADTATERSIGLMYRENLEPDEGMLFIFEFPQNVSFWMKNTLIPLDIVFIDESGTVVNIEQANPEPGVSDVDLTHYSSDRPIKWVMEINQGLCASHGIIPGTAVLIDLK